MNKRSRSVPKSDAESDVGSEEVVWRNAFVGQHDCVADGTDAVSTFDVRVVTRNGFLGFVELQSQPRLTA